MSEFEIILAAIKRETNGNDVDVQEIDGGGHQIHVLGGYDGFYSILTFRPDGTFKSVEAWE